MGGRDSTLSIFFLKTTPMRSLDVVTNARTEIPFSRRL
jgi:hypothetical protein